MPAYTCEIGLAPADLHLEFDYEQMQLELTLTAEDGAGYAASDLGYLLHKNPARVFSRESASGTATVFYSENTEQRCTAVLYLDVDSVALVRGKNKQASGLLDQYVNDRPYVASSLLSVAINKYYSQTMAGKSRDRQSLADAKLPLRACIVPVCCKGGETFLSKLFTPLGYECSVVPVGDRADQHLYSVTLTGYVQLSALLNHLYVLIPVFDNAKHWWVDRDEIANLLNKGGVWLAQHPERKLIARRALKHRRELSDELLDRLVGQESEEDASDAITDTDMRAASPAHKGTRENVLEAPIRLHDQRLERVLLLLQKRGVSRVLDLGCGEGKLITLLLRDQSFTQIVGVDPSLRTLRRASERFYLDDGGQALRERLQFHLGSLTYADRRLRGFDAATLVEVIEHIEPARLGAMVRSLFGDARPSLVIVTTPNAEYNVLFESLAAGQFRHEDHRFEWTRAEFSAWCAGVAGAHGYSVEVETLGPVDAKYGAPSQLARFSLVGQEVSTT